MTARKLNKKALATEARKKVLAAEAQILGMLAGELSEFHCPYCECITTEGQMFCCNPAAEVVNAVLDHVEFKRGVELADQIMDRFSAAESKVILN